MPLRPAKLWIVATPIGNAGDLSPRACEVLRNADLVLAEDTRRAGAMLARHGIAAKKMLSFFEHNEQERQGGVLALLREGKNIAIITDAGTPLLSDPGYRLVRACRKEGISVSPIPGPSAPLAALSAAGIAPLPFTFLGFLPRGNKGRAEIFRAFGKTPATMVFFERKDRVLESLEIAQECLGNREFAICRELTKEYEEFIIGSLGDLSAVPENLLGEITVVIGPPDSDGRDPEEEVLERLQAVLATGVKKKEAARMVKDQCQGWTTAELYALVAGGAAKSPR